MADGHIVVAEPSWVVGLAMRGMSTGRADLEKAFVKVARLYAEREGISYSAWRAVGVSAPVLQKAKIPRTRS